MNKHTPGPWKKGKTLAALENAHWYAIKMNHAESAAAYAKRITVLRNAIMKAEGQS